MSSIFCDGDFISGKLIKDDNNNIWGFTKKYLFYFAKDNLNNLKISKIPISNEIREQLPGYENISLISNKRFLIGLSNGYLTFENKIDQNRHIQHTIEFREIVSKTKYGKIAKKLRKDISSNIDFTTNNLSFSLETKENDFIFSNKYHYMLESGSQKRNDWSNNESITYNNLSPGKYVFKATSNKGDLQSNNLKFEFNILRPWYFSNKMFVLYSFTLILILWSIYKTLIYFLNKKILAIEKEKERQILIVNLSNEKNITELKNLNLIEQVKTKNKLLKDVSFNNLKKGELLNKVQKETQKDLNNSVIKKINALINVGLKNKKDWLFFQDAFNNLDNNFLNKLKTQYPNLTSNDLKFCSYIRINLSTKEIASLFNISVKSVEVKRYRLRKKMELTDSQDLTSYIIGFKE